MFGMKNEKASGLVGFLAEIFKQTQSVVGLGGDVVATIKYLFDSSKLSK